MGDRCNRTINSEGPSVPRALHVSKSQQQKILEAGPHALSPDISTAGSMQLKISVLTFFPYQSLKVNTKLLIRTKHKKQVKRLLTERSVLHQQLRSPLTWSTHALVSKSHVQKKGYRKQPLHLHLCYKSPLGLVFAAKVDIPVSYQTTLTQSPNLGFLPQKTNKTLRKCLPDISKAATTHSAWPRGSGRGTVALALDVPGNRDHSDPHQGPPRTGEEASCHILPGMFPNWALLPH